MFVVLVADTDIDPEGNAEEEVIGPFDNEGDALDWAIQEGRYLATILPVTFRSPSHPF